MRAVPAPDHDGIVFRAQIEHEPPRFIARNAKRAGLRRDESVERHRHLQRDIRTRRIDDECKALDQFEARGIVGDVDRDTGIAHAAHASAVRTNVRIDRTDDHTRDAGGDHGQTARRIRRFVIVRLERDVHRRAAHVGAALARDAQCFGFRMRLAATMMPAFGERHPVANDHRTDRRIRFGVRNRARGQFDRTLEIGRVSRVYGATSTPFQKAT